MSTNATDSSLSFSKLGELNYSTWSVNMKAYLMQKKVWFIVSGEDTRPSPGSSDLREWLKDSLHLVSSSWDWRILKSHKFRLLLMIPRRCGTPLSPFMSTDILLLASMHTTHC